MIKQFALLSGRCERLLDHQQRRVRSLTKVKMARKRGEPGGKRRAGAERAAPKSTAWTDEESKGHETRRRQPKDDVGDASQATALHMQTSVQRRQSGGGQRNDANRRRKESRKKVAPTDHRVGLPSEAKQHLPSKGPLPHFCRYLHDRGQRVDGGAAPYHPHWLSFNHRRITSIM